MKFKLLISGFLIEFKVNRWLYRNRIERLQKKRLKRLFQHLKKSPFYRQYIGSNTRLEDFPIINKSIFMEKFDEINVEGIGKKEALDIALNAEKNRDFSPELKGITIGLSSGTSGNSGVFLVSPKERARWVAAVLDRVIGFSLKKRRVAFFLRANSNLYESAKSSLLEFRFFDIFLPFEVHLEKIQSLQPHVIVAQPSVLRSLAEAIETGKIKLSPDKVISVAEVLYPEDRAYFERIFRAKVSEVYQCTEGFLAATCPKGKLHINEDFIFIEKKFIDEEKRRFHPVITDLLRYTQPVIRYELNDILISGEGCGCNWPGMPLDFIEGRSDDTWIFEDDEGKRVRIFSDLVRRTVLRTSGKISYYMLSQEGPREIAIYLETNAGASSLAELRQKLESEVKNLLGKFRISSIKIIHLQALPHHAGSKLRRIQNNFTNEN